MTTTNITANLIDNEEQNADFIDDDITFTPATLPETTTYADRNYMLDPHMDTCNLIDIDAPDDKYKFTYMVFYLLGTATMTPWNFFITAEDYWMYKFRNTTANDPVILTPLQESFTCDLTLTASISGTLFLILHAIYGQHISLKFKILGNLLIILIVFIITTAFVEVNTDKWQEQFFLITLLTVVVINVASAVMCGAVFGIAGLFPSEYMTALVSGQSLGGIFTALTFIFVLAFGASPKTTALVYFIIGSLLMLFSVISYAVMCRQPFFKFYAVGDKNLTPTTTTTTLTLQVGNQMKEANLREVFGKIYVHAVTICLLFATTLSVYPGITVLMQSQYFGNGSKWNDVYYLPVVNYLFFNSGDYFGRIIAGCVERPRDNPHTALLMTFVRIIFIPLFLCSNSDLHHFLPILVKTDAAFIMLIIAFALSNGYLTNILLIMAPRTVMQHEKEIASSIMAASLSLGLALGSMLSMTFVQML